MGINLRTLNYSQPQPDYRSGEVLRRVRMIDEVKEANQVHGLVTEGIIEAVQGSGSFGWAITDFIGFGYKYHRAPMFTWGLEGTYSGVPADPTPHATTGGNNYGEELPPALQAYIDDGDMTTFQPALFIPRIIHWVMENSYYYVGCYIMVTQVNPNVTEVDKVVRIHYRFDGSGIRL